ncbi:AAA family ATPase [Jatrophihabitans sp. YIM 134969]
MSALPHTEIDALFHGAEWTPRPSFVDDVTALVAREHWVTEYQYRAVRPLLLARCDLYVALELPVALVMSRLLRRTVRRSWRREQLWNGNVEAPLRTVLTDRDHILRWGWRTRRLAATRLREAQVDRPELPVVVLRSPRDVRTWLAGPLAAASA